jgi:hypothetical protein
MSSKNYPFVVKIPLNQYTAIVLYPERITCGIAITGTDFVTDRRLTIGPVELERHKVTEIAEAFARLAGEMHERKHTSKRNQLI